VARHSTAPSAEGADGPDGADGVVVEFLEPFGVDPVLEDRLAADLLDLGRAVTDPRLPCFGDRHRRAPSSAPTDRRARVARG
jgi:hypothetical protein